MSNSVFPSLPGMDVSPVLSSEARTTNFRTVSGRRQSVSWGSPIPSYRVRFNYLRESVMAPSPWGAYSQAAIVKKFWDDHRDFDSFLMDVPEIGGATQKRVKFIAPSFRMPRLFPGCWSCEFEVEVVT